MSEQKLNITAEEFDRLFEEGETDMTQFFDLSKARWHGREKRTVAVDLPASVVSAIERESDKPGGLLHD